MQPNCPGTKGPSHSRSVFKKEESIYHSPGTVMPSLRCVLFFYMQRNAAIKQRWVGPFEQRPSCCCYRETPAGCMFLSFSICHTTLWCAMPMPCMHDDQSICRQLAPDPDADLIHLLMSARCALTKADAGMQDPMAASLPPSSGSLFCCHFASSLNIERKKKSMNLQ